jgi:hypothetical protein
MALSLQFEADGVYTNVPAVPDALLVICGTVATLVSEGQIKPPRHHVVAPGENDRVGSGRTSSVLFLRSNSNFEFDVKKARVYGFKVILEGDRATFGGWMGWELCQDKEDVENNGIPNSLLINHIIYARLARKSASSFPAPPSG